MDVETIRAKIRAGKYIISFTHTEKVRLRKIEAEEIEQAICNGAIIEPYPDAGGILWWSLETFQQGFASSAERNTWQVLFIRYWKGWQKIKAT
jgi:hypothetical protein